MKEMYDVIKGPVITEKASTNAFKQFPTLGRGAD